MKFNLKQYLRLDVVFYFFYRELIESDFFLKMSFKNVGGFGWLFILFFFYGEFVIEVKKIGIQLLVL